MMSGAEAVYMLILMRMKNELNPYDELRFHKSTLFLNIFSQKKCFKINNYLIIDYYPEIEQLAKQQEQLISTLNANSEDYLDVFYQMQEQRIKESYQRSIPYILHSAHFINSITDNRTLVLVSALVGLLDMYPQSNIDDLMELLDQFGYSHEIFSRQKVLTTIINLERSGMFKQSEGKYSLKYNYKGVTAYKNLFL